MKFNQDFLKSYLMDAPLPLAVERSWECEILAQQEFPKPILDIGCGEGIFARQLFQDKVDSGLDPNADEIDRAKKFDKYDELLVGFGQEINKPDKSFQTVMCNSALEHMDDINAVLKEVHRVMKDDGLCYLTLPTDNFEQFTGVYQILSGLGIKSLANRYAKFFNKFWRHYHCYPCEQWEEIFAKTGFKVAKRIEYGDKVSCMLNDILAPFSFPAFVAKKTTNRWFLTDITRLPMARLLYQVFKNRGKPQTPAHGQSGLVFYALAKANA